MAETKDASMLCYIELKPNGTTWIAIKNCIMLAKINPAHVMLQLAHKCKSQGIKIDNLAYITHAVKYFTYK